MQVTKNITLDLLETGSPVIIKAKQHDRNTRYIAAHLYVGRLDYQMCIRDRIWRGPESSVCWIRMCPQNSNGGESGVLAAYPPKNQIWVTV